MPSHRATPAGDPVRYLLGDGAFRFACHDGVPCFTRCCHDADMYLYPCDVIRLKRRLGITSEEFLARHTITAFRENPHFPNVMMKMSDGPEKPCPFLSEAGCTVYGDRPYSCRAYPLEPALYGDEDGGFGIRCSVVRHGHCLGHREGREWTAEEWIEDQGMAAYHEINAEWAKVHAVFDRNPWGEKGVDSPAMKMAYMAAYNIDTFRRFVFDSTFLSRFHVPPERLEKVRGDDAALLLLGFDWIRRFLAGQGPLREKGAGA